MNELTKRTQHCLIEQLYEMDKMNCRLRYNNLRLNGVDTEEYDSPIDAVVSFAADQSVAIDPSRRIFYSATMLVLTNLAINSTSPSKTKL